MNEVYSIDLVQCDQVVSQRLHGANMNGRYGFLQLQYHQVVHYKLHKDI
jgi:hypothetical protein